MKSVKMHAPLTLLHSTSWIFLRDNWQEMVTEEIKTHFRKANRQVDKKI